MRTRKVRRKAYRDVESTLPISDLKFDLYKSLLSSVLFFVGYLWFIRQLDRSFTTFLYIFGWNLLSNMIIEFSLRLMYMRFKGLFTNQQEYLQNIIESFFTSMIIYLQLIPYLQEQFGIKLTDAGWEVLLEPGLYEMMVWVLFIRLALTYIADGIADKITFQ
jgi:hypothetical protein